MKILTKNIWLVTDVDCVSNEWIGGFSPLEIKIITQFAVHPILHLFCGNSQIGEIRVDINPKSQANMVMNVFDYIHLFRAKPFSNPTPNEDKPNVETILMDPIYCSVDKTAEWRRAYADVGMVKNDLYIYPYDAARTKVLFDWIKEVNPNRVIIKSLGHIPIDGFRITNGFNIYVGAFKPARCITIYERENGRLF